MKKHLFYILATLPMLLVACDKPAPEVEEPPQPEPTITLSTERVELSVEGGEAIIQYSVENPVEGVELTAQCDAEWISDIVIDDTEIRLTVAKNLGEARDTKVIVEYDTTTAEVAVLQEAFEGTNFKATILSGEYYSAESLYWNAHNYYFTLSDAVIDRNNPVPNSTYFYFDLYSEEATEDFSIPYGTYTFDPESQWLAGTLNGGKTYGFSINATGSDYAEKYFFTEGEVTVSERSIEARFMRDDGTEVLISYEGDLTITNASPEEEEEEKLSTLSGDVELNLTGASIAANYYGDWYTADSDNWTIRIYEDSERMNGVFIQLELLADPAADTWAAHYNALQDNSLSDPNDYLNTYIKGYLSEGQIAGSWYAVLSDGGINYSMAPIMDGEVDVVLNSDGTKTITFDCTDDAGHKITGIVTEAAAQ